MSPTAALVRKVVTTLVGVSCLAAAACGERAPGPDAASNDPVEATQAKLADVDRATLDLRLTATAGSGSEPSGEVGFTLHGPFEAPAADGALPIARLESTRLAGPNNTTATFISTGKRAFVEQDGAVTELTDSQLDGLRATTSEDADQLGGLHLDRWFADRKTTKAGGTTTVTGALDPVVGINDVFGLAGAFGAGTGQRRIEGDDADRLRKLVLSSDVELVTGNADHLLRSLTFDIRFAPGTNAEIERLLPKLSGVGLHFQLRLADVGKPVVVEEPTP